MKKLKKFFTLPLALLVCGCNGGNHVADAHPDGKEEEHHIENEIVINKDHVDGLGIRTAKVAPSQFREVIAVSGEIAPAQGSMKSAVAKSAGIVTFAGSINEGVAVGKGAQICRISADGIVGGDSNMSAKIAYEAAEAEYERLKPLYENKIVTATEFNAAKEKYELAKNAYAGGDGYTTVDSPLSGVVTQLLVENGSYVEAGTAVATVSESRKLTLHAYLPKKLFGKFSSIKSANFKLPYSDSVYSLEDMQSRKLTSGNVATPGGYIDIAFDFDNAGGILPGTYAEVYLLGQEKENALVLPLSSLTEEMGYFYVYVEHEKGCYEKRRVDVGGSDGKNIEIVSGIKPGESVVTEGAVVVKIAANSSAVPEGHHHH